MNILDYYSDFLLHINCQQLCKGDIESINPRSYNLHLYILEDEISNPRTVTICCNTNSYKYYIDGPHVNEDKYKIFIPYKDYMFTISADTQNIFFLHWYKEHLTLSFSYQETKDFIDWIGIDELQDKLNKALEFLIMTLKIMHNYSIEEPIKKEIDIFYDGSQYYTSDVYRYVDCGANYCELESSREIFYEVCNGVKKKFYLNVNVNGYSLDVHPIGDYVGTMYYFPLGKNRHLVLSRNHEMCNTALWLIKDNKVIIKAADFVSTLKEILILIEKEYVYKKIKKANIIEDNPYAVRNRNAKQYTKCF